MELCNRVVVVALFYRKTPVFVTNVGSRNTKKTSRG